MYQCYDPLATYLSEQLPALFWVELYKGQLENLEGFDCPILPAVLIDLNEINWTDTSGHSQLGETDSLRIVCLVKLPSHTNALDPKRPDNLESLQLINHVHQKLIAFPGILKRTKSRQYALRSEEFDLFVCELIYTARFEYHYEKYIKPPQSIQPGISAQIIPNLNTT